MDLGLKGKTALVLGAGGGLGGAVAAALCSEGARVALADKNESALETVHTRLGNAGASVMGVPWDLAALNTIDRNVNLIEAALGPIDILFNNTGGPPPTTAHDQSAQLWEENFRAMIVSVIKLTDRVLPHMRGRNWGRVITSSSSGVIAPIPNLALSNSLRLALVGWSKTLAAEVGKDGVTVNIVAPGRIATDRIQFLDAQKAKRETRDIEAVQADSTATIPLGRYGKPEEYGRVVAFLASECASYVTGSTIRVDGGYIPNI